MAFSLENGQVSVENKAGLVRPATEAHAEEAIQALKTGKVIAVPTDTLYGFACDACSLEAVNRIYEIKGRKHTSPLAICVGDVSDINRFAVTDHLPHGLLDSLLPGPVTVVLSRGIRKIFLMYCQKVPCVGVESPQLDSKFCPDGGLRFASISGISAGESSNLEKSLNPGLESIGVRVPDSNFVRVIARGLESALALTSANLTGQPSSVSVKDFENLWEHCAYVYDGGVLPSGRAGSTVVDLTRLGKFKILRPGSAKEETTAILEKHSLVEEPAAG
ncbi:DHBP synthase RibB-like alpha/beta domain-containing protein [Citrus sinensis]|uniref:DHBP synthase RibB-like alpha/beta domain-containing protein n=1 Tax=Citrus sinensis TaxID=2711 RepID=A0ACB8IUN3_CITSI|nr:DHBP synthase RibB-like alpha/beta domain-containing protein [Citrus sinensis]